MNQSKQQTLSFIVCRRGLGLPVATGLGLGLGQGLGLGRDWV